MEEMRAEIALQTHSAEPGMSNAARVMSLVRSESEIARVEISRRTGLSPATVTALTSDLMSAGMIEGMPVEETGAEGGHARRGRPRVNLRVRGSAHRVIGAKLADTHITVALLDFAGQTLAEGEYPLPPGSKEAETVGQNIADALRRICEENGLGLDEISGLCIGIPGFVDGPRGMVHWSRSFDRRNVPLTEILARHFACPIFVENDANLIAMGELWFGHGRKVKDFVAVTLENGLGMGIVIDGKLYRGSRRRGAELGHTKVALDGALCSCGQRGCLEAYVAEYALLREANLVIGPKNTLGSAEEQLDALYAKAQAGEPRALEIFRRAGRMFGLGLANVVNIFDPSMIVLSGASMRYTYLHDEDVLNEMRANIIKVDGTPPEVRVHEWGDVLWAKGAGAMALEGITDIALRKLEAQRSPVV